MLFNKIGYTLSKKDKNINFSIDSSRATNSISTLNDSDTAPLKADTEFEENRNLENSYLNNENNNDTFNIKINMPTNNNDNSNLKNKSDFFLFKIQFSVILCVIYFLLFLLSIPKRPMKIGNEKTLTELVKDNNNSDINILLNDFKFFYGDIIENKTNLNNNMNKTFKIENNNNNMDFHKNSYELIGSLLEFKYDKIYMFRWFIGFLYFIVRCVCFIYSHEKQKEFLFHKIKFSHIQKFSCLIFPLWIFFYDLKNNITYMKIKNELINNKIISYYIITEKQFSMIDYVEGIIPTLFYFLISIIYNGIEQSLGAYFRNRKKMSKLI